MEIKLIMASILQKYRFVPTENTQKVLELDPSKRIFVGPKGKILLRIEKHNLD